MLEANPLSCLSLYIFIDVTDNFIYGISDNNFAKGL